jgi:hypothetical protein
MDNKSKPLSSKKADIAEGMYERLLETAGVVDPKLQDLLRQKYEEEEREFSLAANEAKPSNNPEYWAKKSCRKCYGRGIIGQRHIFRSNESACVEGKKYSNSMGYEGIGCKCTSKNYQKWLVDFRMFYNMLKAQTIAEVVNSVEEGKSDEV